ncbi:uncharacterized protein LOC144440380 [Glandiceps talaboti]
MKLTYCVLLLFITACAHGALEPGGICQQYYPDKPYGCASTKPGMLMCIGAGDICDGLYYCGDGADEEDCDYSAEYGTGDGSCKASDNTKVGDDAQAFQDQMVAAHNYFRCLHDSPDVTWSTAMQQKAQTAIDYSASLGVLTHSNYGENLARVQIPISSTTGYGLVRMWYSEIADYNYEDYKASTGTVGHFTQVVWAESVEVGCAYAVDINGDTQIACEYDPPGNLNTLDAHLANVKKPI